MLLADFSAETLQTKKEWEDIFKVERKKTAIPRIPSEVILQKWRWDEFPKTYLTRNTESNSWGWNERIPTSNMKTYENK